MTPPLRDTKYAREIATARLPTGSSGSASAAIERIYVKQTAQEEIRFSLWEGNRMVPRPLDLPEDELLALLEAALETAVFSDAFAAGLRRILKAAPAEEDPALASSDLGRVQAHMHALMRSRAGDLIRTHSTDLPRLEAGVGTQEEPGWCPIEGMDGGFRYWWDASASGLRLITESWDGSVQGSGQLHEITPTGARLLGEGFV